MHGASEEVVKLVASRFLHGCLVRPSAFQLWVFIMNGRVLLAFFGIALFWFPVRVSASPDVSGPCSRHLQRLGYQRVQLDASLSYSSVYEARRGPDEVKILIANSGCAIKQVWLDD